MLTLIAISLIQTSSKLFHSVFAKEKQKPLLITVHFYSTLQI